MSKNFKNASATSTLFHSLLSNRLQTDRYAHHSTKVWIKFLNLAYSQLECMCSNGIWVRSIQFCIISKLRKEFACECSDAVTITLSESSLANYNTNFFSRYKVWNWKIAIIKTLVKWYIILNDFYELSSTIMHIVKQENTIINYHEDFKQFQSEL